MKTPKSGGGGKSGRWREERKAMGGEEMMRKRNIGTGEGTGGNGRGERREDEEKGERGKTNHI